MFNNGYNGNRYYSLWRSYRINRETAIQIALQQVPGQVINVELYYDYGTLIYEINIRTTSGVYEVYIDAFTGQIYEIERAFNFD